VSESDRALVARIRAVEKCRIELQVFGHARIAALVLPDQWYGIYEIVLSADRQYLSTKSLCNRTGNNAS